MSLRLSGINPLAYSGVEPLTPPQFEIHDRAPTANDYISFNVGTIWLHKRTGVIPTAEDIYVLVSKDAQVATWVALAGTSAMETLTGNIGGAVSPDGNDNINVVGDNVNLTIAGNPATNTLTVSIINTLDHSLQLGNASGGISNLGVATNGQLPIGSTGADPVLATLTAGNNIFITNGAGSITVSTTTDVADSFPTDSGTATPANGVLNILGDGILISTSAPGPANTVQISADYETGTWTPVLSFGGDTTGITYTSRTGEYIRIGQLVFINFSIVLSSKGTATGTALISGFPFSNTGALIQNHVYAAANFITLDAGYTQVGLAFSGSAVNIEAYGSTLNRDTLDDANFANNTEIVATFCYSTGAL